MKKLVFNLEGDLFNAAFPRENIYERTPLLLIIIEACKYMMYNEQVFHSDNKFMLVVDEMNRLFFCKHEKMYSVKFPFHVNLFPAIWFDYEQIPIDSKLLSIIIEILDSKEFKSDYVLDLLVPIGDLQDHECQDLWKIFLHLLTYDIGYIRYDDDPEGFRRASDRGAPKQHPRYHYDVNIESQASFKLGLARNLTPDGFVDFLDNKKDRYMLKQP